jgi:hypothetical protein
MRTRSDVHPNPSLVSNVFPPQDAVARIVASAKPLNSIPSANCRQITFLESSVFWLPMLKEYPLTCKYLPVSVLLACR